MVYFVQRAYIMPYSSIIGGWTKQEQVWHNLHKSLVVLLNISAVCDLAIAAPDGWYVE
jgi:hypothetical protein